MRPVLLIAVLLSLSCRTVELSPAAARIDDALTRMVPFGLSGSVVVSDRGKVVLSKGYGSGLKPDTIYDMGSITKSFTATAILLLEHDGRLATGDTLGKHFPTAPADKRGITLDQILSHAGGLPDLIGSDYDPVARDEFVKRFLATPLVAAPGAGFNYSNGGYSLLAVIIEQSSGMAYEQFLKKRMFEPAGMRDTTYLVPRRALHRVAHTSTPPLDHGSPAERLARAGGVHWILLGNGGMLTTAEDLHRWEMALGRESIVPRRVYEKLMTPILKRSDSVSVAAAWTMEMVDGERVMHHGSDAPEFGVNGEYRRYPDDHFTVIFLGNTRLNGASPRRVVGRQVRKLWRGGEVKAPGTTHASDVTRYAGSYVLPDGSSIDVRAASGHLVAGMNGQSAIDLFTVQRSEQSLAARRRLNDEAKDVAAKNGLTNVQVLGTSRRDRGVFMTTLRAHHNGTPKTFRFAWSGPEPGSDSDDGTLPAVGPLRESPIRFALERPLWRESADRFIFYDIYADDTIRVEFQGDSLVIGGVTAFRQPASDVM